MMPVDYSNTTSYERCLMIRQVFLIRASEVATYSSWSDGFAAKYIREIPAHFKKLTNFKDIVLQELTKEQMIELGFKKWSEDSSFYLIPQYLLSFLQYELTLHSVLGGLKTYRREELDDDARFGCLAYGICPKK